MKQTERPELSGFGYLGFFQSFSRGILLAFVEEKVGKVDLHSHTEFMLCHFCVQEWLTTLSVSNPPALQTGNVRQLYIKEESRSLLSIF